LVNTYDMRSLAAGIRIKGRNFLTRDKGEEAYVLLQEQLLQTAEGQALVLVFPSEQLVDSSFADESIVRLGEQILRGMFGERAIVMEGLTEDSIKNFSAVLKLRGIKLPLLTVWPTGEWRVLGSLEENLHATLRIVQKHGQLRASDLASTLGLAVNTASTRLKRLHNLHLVRREFEISNKGLEYVYYFWLKRKSS
jgi:hypothetical protein